MSAFSVLTFLLGSASGIYADEYKLGVGDVIELTLLGIQDYSKRITVGIDGRVRVPGGGSFAAAERTIEELSRDIRVDLAKKTFPMAKDAQGETMWDVVYPESVMIDIVEYRPVYVAGGVLTPGSQPFRPGLTMQQAVSVAGGYSLFPARASSDPLYLIGIEKDYGRYLTEVASVQTKVIRLTAELSGESKIDFSSLIQHPMLTDFNNKLKFVESEQLAARARQRGNQNQSLKLAIEQANKRLSLLSDKQSNVDKEMESYRAELARVSKLYEKGLVQIGMLTDAQRTVLFGSTRALETSAEVSRLARDLVDLNRALAEVDEDHQIEILRELKEAGSQLAEARAKLAKVAAQLAYPNPSLLDGTAEPTVHVVRIEGGHSTKFSAADDALLMPGDVLEISFAAEGNEFSRDTNIFDPGITANAPLSAKE